MNLSKKPFSDISIPDSDIGQAIDFFAPKITERRLNRLKIILNNRSNFIVPVMEDLYQEQNAGAIVRTAECCGFQEVGIVERLNRYKMAPGIAKGAQKWVDKTFFDARYDDPMQLALQHYRDRGYALVGACPHSEGFTAETLPLNKPLAIFFGAEKMGLHSDLKSNMDNFVSIPMRGFTESYNVSVSAAIILQTLRQRLEELQTPYLLDEPYKQSLLLKWIIQSIPKGKEQLVRWQLEMTQ
ncbi:MAG: RNA methyltransferase [Cryomorphaceae bacterium]|nr:RNA methyltransferase [Cryomorphaceae bacterium]